MTSLNFDNPHEEGMKWDEDEEEEEEEEHEGEKLNVSKIYKTIVWGV